MLGSNGKQAKRKSKNTYPKNKSTKIKRPTTETSIFYLRQYTKEKKKKHIRKKHFMKAKNAVFDFDEFVNKILKKQAYKGIYKEATVKRNKTPTFGKTRARFTLNSALNNQELSKELFDAVGYSESSRRRYYSEKRQSRKDAVESRLYNYLRVMEQAQEGTATVLQHASVLSGKSEKQIIRKMGVTKDFFDNSRVILHKTRASFGYQIDTTDKIINNVVETGDKTGIDEDFKTVATNLYPLIEHVVSRGANDARIGGMIESIVKDNPDVIVPMSTTFHHPRNWFEPSQGMFEYLDESKFNADDEGEFESEEGTEFIVAATSIMLTCWV